MLLTKQQKIFLLRLIKAKKHILFTPFDGVNVTFEKKRESWQWILEQLRANGIHYNRDIMYLRYTTWSNLKRTTLSKVYSRQGKPNGKIFNEKDKLVFDIIGQEEVSRAFLKDNNALPIIPKSEPMIDLHSASEERERLSSKLTSSNEGMDARYFFPEQIQSLYDRELDFRVHDVDIPGPSKLTDSSDQHQLPLPSLIENGSNSPIKNSFTTTNTLNRSLPKVVKSISSHSPKCQNDSDLEAAKTEYYRALAHKQKLEIMQIELQMKLDPRYSRENGLLDFYSISPSRM